jgi:tetratricopeptide (TPR) repeat protein
MACGGTPRVGVTPLPLEAPCAKGQQYDGKTCATPGDARQKVSEARTALAAFDVERALPLLDAAMTAGPHEHDLLIDLYEQRGIAYSYLKREGEALKAFGELLDLDPGHLLSYTLSPQATFLYERARTAKEARSKAQLDVSWPQGLREDENVPLVVEVLSDPASMLQRMALYVRSSEKEAYRRVALKLPANGEVATVHLPAPHTNQSAVLQLYGKAYDEKGDEVLLWFDKSRPREIPLAYDAPSPWYRKWWVWAAIGGAVAVGTGTTVYLLGLDPADDVGGVFTLGD